MIPYFIGFAIAEHSLPNLNGAFLCQSTLDLSVPFIPFFVVFYYLWYPFMAVVGVYLLFKDLEAYKRYTICLTATFYIVLLTYIVLPSGLQLRPQAVPGTDVFSALVRGIYAVDTPTNVFPSGHVLCQMAALFAVYDSKQLRKWWIRLLATLLSLGVILSTVFIKQHSLLDVLGGLMMSVAVWLAVYGKREASKQI